MVAHSKIAAPKAEMAIAARVSDLEFSLVSMAPEVLLEVEAEATAALPEVRDEAAIEPVFMLCIAVVVAELTVLEAAEPAR